jgi:hypothetical protein
MTSATTGRRRRKTCAEERDEKSRGYLLLLEYFADKTFIFNILRGYAHIWTR